MESQAGEVGRCINCGRYFDIRCGMTMDVCSEGCGNRLAQEFNEMLR